MPLPPRIGRVTKPSNPPAGGRWFAHPLQRAKLLARTRLDARYALAADVARLEQTLERQQAEIQRLRASTDCAGARFVGDENPHELRRRLFEARRLAVESATAIERLLQQEIMLWAALDSDQERVVG